MNAKLKFTRTFVTYWYLWVSGGLRAKLHAKLSAVELLRMNTTISERLLALRGKTKQGDFAKLLGINPNTLRNYENGRVYPNQEILERICVTFSVLPEWLLMGTGPMKNESPTAHSLPPSPSKPSELVQLVPFDGNRETDVIEVPLVEARLSAGIGSLQVSAERKCSYAFPAPFLLRKGNPKEMVLMCVEGDSMQPEIMDGDMVLIDQSQKEIRLGRIFAVGFEEAIYLKRIDMLPGKVVLKSVNPAYPPLEFDISGQQADLFRVIGQVLWCGREYH